jgi:hypothetical protein
LVGLNVESTPPTIHVCFYPNDKCKATIKKSIEKTAHEIKKPKKKNE